jgi:nucleoside-diphosphate-sugar epimerase
VIPRQNRLILVTGGAGFMGSHLVAALAARGERVRVLDSLATGKRNNLAGLEGVVDFRIGDIRRPEDVRGAVQGADCVVHLAGLRGVPRSQDHPGLIREVNVTGTSNVLACARAEGVTRVVYASSVLVYGGGPFPQEENQIPRPVSPYGASKLESEALCQGRETVILRYFNVYGPRQDPGSPYAAVIPEFISRLAADEPYFIFGDGRQTRDFVYVEDAVRATLAACTARIAPGTVINVGSGRETSVAELAAFIRRLLGKQREPAYRPPRPNDTRRSLAHTRRCRELLALEDCTSIEVGLKKAIVWHLKNRAKIHWSAPLVNGNGCQPLF